MSGTLVEALIDCPCHKIDKIKLVEGRYYCHNCGNPVSILLIGNSSSHGFFGRKCVIKLNVLDKVHDERLIEDIRGQYERKISILENSNKELNEKYNDCRASMAAEAEQYAEKITHLESLNAEMKSQYEDSERSRSNDYENFMKEMADSARSYESKISDLSSYISEKEKEIQYLSDSCSSLEKELILLKLKLLNMGYKFL